MASSSVSIAILILAHKNPSQLKRLVTHLQTDFDVFVHLDRRSEVRVSEFDRFARTTVIKEIKATWGSLGLVHATLKLLSLAFSRGPYDRYVLISGQDVPLKTNGEIAALFLRHPEVDFVDSQPFTPAEESRLTRITRFHFFPRKTLSAVLTTIATNISRRIDNLLSVLGVRRGMNYRFRWGSQWMDLTSETVRQVLEFVQTDKRFLRRFRFTFCSDEVFFQTAIEHCGHAKAELLSPLRYIDWHTGPEHPRVIRMEEVAKLEKSGMLFARKCDTTIDSDLVDRLYARLLPGRL